MTDNDELTRLLSELHQLDTKLKITEGPFDELAEYRQRCFEQRRFVVDQLVLLHAANLSSDEQPT